MPKYNEYINLNKPKPVEIVHELKDEYKIPSFEEFMKTYEGDGNLNYTDLSGGVGEVKGYGPCEWDNPSCSCTPEQLREQMRRLREANRRFRVTIVTGDAGFWSDWAGKSGFRMTSNGSTGWEKYTFTSVGEARSVLRKLETGEYWFINPFNCRTSNAYEIGRAVMEGLRGLISRYENGENIEISEQNLVSNEWGML